MDIKEIFVHNKKIVSDYLTRIITEKRKEWVLTNRWGSDSLDRLLEFMLAGKMVRGSIVLWIADEFSSGNTESLPGAAAMELLQAALLIHDDIMDDDDTRRGLPSIHKQYETLGSKYHYDDQQHFGTSMAICLGDLALFLAFEELAKLQDVEVISLFSKSISIVGLGQMQDVSWGFQSEIPDAGDILSMYDHKTSMYTFTLPFLLGASIAHIDKSLSRRFQELGSVLGQLYQLRDDQLGLYSTHGTMGKSIGIDFVTGKKTPYYSLLLKRADDKDLQYLDSLLSKRSLDSHDLSDIHGLLEKYEVSSAIEDMMGKLEMQAKDHISGMKLSSSLENKLYSLLELCMKRST
ncbi:MAG: polyprenyl synthetase family protein [Nanoarchaeota archaeon]